MESKELPFEEAMQQLEVVASKLEKGDLNLDESVTIFEEGMKLSKQCSELLENAEKRITILLKDEDEIKAYLSKILNREVFDKAGLIYGMGHAVYSISDPRANIFKGFVEKLSQEKGLEKEYRLCALIEKLAPEVIAKERHIYKGVSANIDFYSGFVYNMLNLPKELFTPLFAIARSAGWAAHRMEELLTAGKIIRPAYQSIASKKEYIPIDQRI